MAKADRLEDNELHLGSPNVSYSVMEDLSLPQVYWYAVIAQNS